MKLFGRKKEDAISQELSLHENIYSIALKASWFPHDSKGKVVERTSLARGELREFLTDEVINDDAFYTELPGDSHLKIVCLLASGLTRIRQADEGFGDTVLEGMVRSYVANLYDSRPSFLSRELFSDSDAYSEKFGYVMKTYSGIPLALLSEISDVTYAGRKGRR